MKSKRKTFTPMVWFTLRYAFWGPVLFGLVYFEHFSPFIFINRIQTDLTVFLLKSWVDLYAIPIVMMGPHLIFDHGLKLTVVHECNGMAAYLLFLAAVLSFPAVSTAKIRWLVIGYVIILLANMIRLAWITDHVIEHPEDFKFLHEVVGRYLIAFIPLVLFYFFSEFSPRRKPVGMFKDAGS